MAFVSVRIVTSSCKLLFFPIICGWGTWLAQPRRFEVMSESDKKDVQRIQTDCERSRATMREWCDLLREYRKTRQGAAGKAGGKGVLASVVSGPCFEYVHAREFVCDFQQWPTICCPRSCDVGRPLPLVPCLLIPSRRLRRFGGPISEMISIRGSWSHPGFLQRRLIHTSAQGFFPLGECDVLAARRTAVGRRALIDQTLQQSKTFDNSVLQLCVCGPLCSLRVRSACTFLHQVPCPSYQGWGRFGRADPRQHDQRPKSAMNRACAYESSAP